MVVSVWKYIFWDTLLVPFSLHFYNKNFKDTILIAVVTAKCYPPTFEDITVRATNCMVWLD